MRKPWRLQGGWEWRRIPKFNVDADLHSFQDVVSAVFSRRRLLRPHSSSNGVFVHECLGIGAAAGSNLVLPFSWALLALKIYICFVAVIFQDV